VYLNGKKANERKKEERKKERRDERKKEYRDADKYLAQSTTLSIVFFSPGNRW
jgi:hypothetical protein